MNFIEFESAQKLRGGFYTDTDLAEFLTCWVAVMQPQRILEPSCGEGVFLGALQKCAVTRLKSVVACELNPKEAAKAKNRIKTGRAEIHVGDFLRWFRSNAGTINDFGHV